MDGSDEFTYDYEVAYGENIYAPEVNNLQTQGAHCSKNPGHKGFISVNDFHLSHLPPEFRHKDLFEFFLLQADLTVLVKTKFVSQGRPDRFPGSQFRGKRCTLTGTGYCYGVDRYDNPVFNQSVQPKSSRWELVVQLSAHVICDGVEAANTEVVFLYNDTDRDSQTVTVHGTRMGDIDIENDRCFLVCVIQDSEMDEFMNKLKRLKQHIKRAGDELREKYRFSLGDGLCVIISHPHGSTKQISVGKWEGGVSDRNGGHMLCYTTPTCPGSSGASVGWTKWVYGLYGPPHCKGGKNGIGRSGKYKSLV